MSLRKATIRLAADNPKLRPLLLPLLKKAKCDDDEGEKEGKFERGEDVPVDELPAELQKNVKNPPPSVQKVKEQIKSKKAEDDEGEKEGKFERGEDVPVDELPAELQKNVKNPPPSVQKVKEKIKSQNKGNKAATDPLFAETVKLAQDNPDLRAALIPVLKKHIADSEIPTPPNPSNDRANAMGYEPGKTESAKGADYVIHNPGLGLGKEGATLLAETVKIAGEKPDVGAKLLPSIREAMTLPLLDGELEKFAGDKWKKMPKGWTDDSRKKFWASLTSAAPKHKVSECIKKMDGKVANTGAFCASLADRVMGKEWRTEAAKDRADKKAAMRKYPNEGAAKKYAKEKGLSYGWSVLSSGWYVGTKAELKKIGVHTPKTASVSDWMSIDEVRSLCPPCADKMAAYNLTQVKASTIRKAMDMTSKKKSSLVKQADRAAPLISAMMKVYKDAYDSGPKGLKTPPDKASMERRQRFFADTVKNGAWHSPEDKRTQKTIKDVAADLWLLGMYSGSYAANLLAPKKKVAARKYDRKGVLDSFKFTGLKRQTATQIGSYMDGTGAVASQVLNGMRKDGLVDHETVRGKKMWFLTGKKASIAPRRASQIAKTIADQMGGMNRLRAMLGASRIEATSNGRGLAIQWPNRQRSKGNNVEITLRGDDTYDMEFFNASMRGKKSVRKYKQIYADQLIPMFYKQTGWALRLGASRVAEQWIQKAIKDPGRVREYLKIPEGEKIPAAKLNAAIKKLKESGGDASLLKALEMAKTLKKMGAARDLVWWNEGDDKWYQKFDARQKPEPYYFKPTKKQKNGGLAGVLWRGTNKAVKSSVTKFERRDWRELPESEVPGDVKSKMKARL